MHIFSLIIIFLCSLLFSSLDVVIPVHSKDKENIEVIISKVRENIDEVGNIYIISKDRYTDEASWVDESYFPFSIDDVGRELGGRGGIGNHQRCGWYFQQLLKFYSYLVIEDLSDNFLILDADTIPNKKMSFFSPSGKVYLNCLFHKGCFYRTYYHHMKKILPDQKNIFYFKNPVVHHMVFSKSILSDLFERVESKFNKSFWQVFLNTVDVSGKQDSLLAQRCCYKAFEVGASEYIIYFNFALNYHRDKVCSRNVRLYTCKKGASNKAPSHLYDFISDHKYLPR